MLITIMSIHNKVKLELFNNYNLVVDMIKIIKNNFTQEDRINVDMLYKTEMLFLNTLANIYLDLYFQKYNDIENKHKLLTMVAHRRIDIYNTKTTSGYCNEDEYVMMCDGTKHQLDCVKSYIKAVAC